MPLRHLLLLPAELRLHILRLLVTQSSLIALWQTLVPCTLDLNIMRTCHQLRDEGRDLLYNENTVHIGIVPIHDSRGAGMYIQHRPCHVVTYPHSKRPNEKQIAFLKPFSRFQITVMNPVAVHILLSGIRQIKHVLDCKHIWLAMPAGILEGPVEPTRMDPYPYIVHKNPLLAFTILRCKSFTITSHDEEACRSLISLVESREEVLDIANICLYAQCMFHDTASYGDHHSSSLEALRCDLREQLKGMFKSADEIDQGRFTQARDKYEVCLRAVREVQMSRLHIGL